MSRGVALVTGAAQGIGRAIALRLAEDGYDVAVNDIQTNHENIHRVVEEIIALGRKSLALVADVSVEDQVKNMVEAVVKDLGGLDVMIANAGVYLAPLTPLVELEASDWDRLFEVNVRGTFLCYKYAAQQMLAQNRGGRIVGASSVAGKRGSALSSGYSATKFAVRGLTQSAALELGKHGITVNAYAPGAIDTPMLQGVSDTFVQKGSKSGDFRALMSSRAAAGRMGTPQDIASLVSYLVSKEANFITGQSISCDGGINLKL